MPSSTSVSSSLLPTVDFCGLKLTRLIIGANPFGGFSHQNRERDQAMVAYNTVPRILETWQRAYAAGINTIITNNETAHVIQAVREYHAAKGPMQWIAQINCRTKPNMNAAIDEAIDIGCKALYFHGALTDDAFAAKDEAKLREWCDHARSRGVPAGLAGHSPDAHRWAYDKGIADFHVVCFFNCGSLHAGKGEKFRLADVAKAVACINYIKKPCIGYKIMGAGRIDAKMAFEYAFENIKPNDAVNVGMFRGDKDNIVEENAAIVREILGAK
ncbi:MAG: hypothetical protein HZC28_14225 [Spirochaetes bacterium]|nr:hypothetical protein [Spirochaetota bacterium]